MGWRSVAMFSIAIIVGLGALMVKESLAEFLEKQAAEGYMKT
ncbi:hypothetical protein [Wenyingzhuangia sp. 2_MG-2023]|nr:hypothetical protein [Wenyingzhuangia sp. 2_MG-2023]MDO6738479.1 hypothetical protein [Wenyingzhuangia sp. 2_MG-2023]